MYKWKSTGVAWHQGKCRLSECERALKKERKKERKREGEGDRSGKRMDQRWVLQQLDITFQCRKTGQAQKPQKKKERKRDRETETNRAAEWQERKNTQKHPQPESMSKSTSSAVNQFPPPSPTARWELVMCGCHGNTPQSPLALILLTRRIRPLLNGHQQTTQMHCGLSARVMGRPLSRASMVERPYRPGVARKKEEEQQGVGDLEHMFYRPLRS